MVSGVRASFDGELLKVKEVGPALHNDKGRGLLEPSVTKFGGKFWITLRAEDNRGYVSVSDDGLNYEEKRAWTWDDETPIEMSTTQQHWLTHSDGLFLVYTRRDESNENVMRWRSPLWVAQVDTDKRCLIKSSEQVVLPLVGDGIDEPESSGIDGQFPCHARQPAGVLGHGRRVDAARWLSGRCAAGSNTLVQAKSLTVVVAEKLAPA